jgi:hypothetical protein
VHLEGVHAVASSVLLDSPRHTVVRSAESTTTGDAEARGMFWYSTMLRFSPECNLK